MNTSPSFGNIVWFTIWLIRPPPQNPPSFVRIIERLWSIVISKIYPWPHPIFLYFFIRHKNVVFFIIPIVFFFLNSLLTSEITKRMTLGMKSTFQVNNSPFSYPLSSSLERASPCRIRVQMGPNPGSFHMTPGRNPGTPKPEKSWWNAKAFLSYSNVQNPHSCKELPHHVHSTRLQLQSSIAHLVPTNQLLGPGNYPDPNPQLVELKGYDLIWPIPWGTGRTDSLVQPCFALVGFQYLHQYRG